MPRNPAYIVAEIVRNHHVNLGDVRIAHANAAAADCYGFAHPRDLVGYFLSQLQPKPHRDVGRVNAWLRVHGYAVPQNYCTVVRTHDGALVGQKRTLLSSMVHDDGASYITMLEPVRSLHEPQLPDLTRLGVSMDRIIKDQGAYTIADIAEFAAHDSYPLPLVKLSPIMKQAKTLALLMGLDQTRAVGLAFDRSKVAWSLHGKAPKLHVVETCEACAWTWHARSWRKAQCPKCFTHFPPRDTVVSPECDMGKNPCNARISREGCL